MLTRGIAPGVSNFINVLDEAMGAADPWTSALQRIPSEAPCVLWISRSLGLQRLLRLPSNVVLSFAPQAVLTINRGGQLELDGRLEVSSGPCFVAEPGAVRLRGALDTIDASWWADRTEQGIGCALSVFWDRVSQGRSVVPVELPGQWRLSRHIRIASSVTDGVELTLRGNGSPAAGVPTLVSTRDLVEPMVRVEGAMVVRFEAIGFHDTERPYPELGAATVEINSTGSGTLFQDCWWLTERHRDVVSIVPSGLPFDPEEAQAELLARAQRPPTRMSFLSCSFFAKEGGVTFVSTTPAWPMSLDFQHCAFQGQYAVGVAVYGDALSMTACSFHNRAPRILTYGNTPRTTTFVGTADVVARALDTKTWGNVAAAPLANAQITLTHCVSRSLTMLSAYTTWLNGPAPLSALLLNVVQAGAENEPDVPALVWDARGGARGLVLQGVQLRGPIEVLASGIGNALVPFVVAVGSRIHFPAVPLPASGAVSANQPRRLLREEVEHMGNDPID